MTPLEASGDLVGRHAGWAVAARDRVPVGRPILMVAPLPRSRRWTPATIGIVVPPLNAVGIWHGFITNGWLTEDLG